MKLELILDFEKLRLISKLDNFELKEKEELSLFMITAEVKNPSKYYKFN